MLLLHCSNLTPVNDGGSTSDSGVVSGRRELRHHVCYRRPTMTSFASLGGALSIMSGAADEESAVDLLAEKGTAELVILA